MDAKKVEFLVMFQKEDGSEYHWCSYKTFGGARRFIRYHWGWWKQKHSHNFDSWAIERRVSVGRRFTKRSIIIAQSKNWHGETGLRKSAFID